jgi:hypothetical protein
MGSLRSLKQKPWKRKSCFGKQNPTFVDPYVDFGFFVYAKCSLCLDYSECATTYILSGMGKVEKRET